MLKLIEDVFKPKMKIHNFKDIIKDTPFIYDLGYNFVASKNGDGFINVSSSNMGYVLSIENSRPFFYYDTFKSIDYYLKPKKILIDKSSLFNFCSIENYIPYSLLTCLNKLSGGSIDMINDISELIANCLTFSPLSGKIFVIKVDDNEDMEKSKKFISKLISYDEYRYSKNNDNMYNVYNTIEILDNNTLKEFCTDEKAKELHSIRYSNIKAIFLDRNADELDLIEYGHFIKLFERKNNKLFNNIQIILFQTEISTDDLRTSDIITIDFSDLDLDDCLENFDKIPAMDFLWAKIYLALYGYNKIKKQTKAKAKIKSDADNFSDDVINKLKDEILDNFITTCFVGKDEAHLISVNYTAMRAKEREKLGGKNANNNELAKAMEKYQLPFVYVKDFKELMDSFIKTQYDNKIVSRYKINASVLQKHLKAKYKSEYPYTDSNLGFNTNKKVYMDLCLKKPKSELIEEFESNQIITANNSEKARDFEDIEQLYKVIKTDIDFSNARKDPSQ